MQQQQVERVDPAALQAALGGHPHVVRVALGTAQARIGEAREALGTFALARVEIVSDGADDGEIRAGDPGERAAEQLVGGAGAIGVRGDDRRDTLIRAQQGSEPVVVDRLPEVHEATAAPCPDRGSRQLRPTFFPKVFTQGPHGMADDTRVTHSRAGLACAFALLCVIGCALPAAASADGHHRPPRPGPERRRARRCARRRRREARADARRSPTPSWSPSPRAGPSQALAALNADPDVRFAVPNVRVHVAAAPSDSSAALAEWGARRCRRSPTPTSTRRRRGRSSRGPGRHRRRRRPARRRRPPRPARQRRRPGTRTSRRPTAAPPAIPTGDDDHGTHVAGHDRRAARQRRRHRRRRAATRTSCRCARSTTAATASSLGPQRVRLRGRGGDPDRHCVVRHRPAAPAPERRDQRRLRRRASTPTRTRCTSSPRATRATTTTTAARSIRATKRRLRHRRPRQPDLRRA